MPNRSREPWTTSVGTVTASSSGSRLWTGAERRGGTRGKARQSTAIAPVAAAVRHATRAPSERPPTTSRRPPSSSARRRSTMVVQDASRWCAGARRAPSRDAVGLLDESDADSFCERDLGDDDEVWRGDSSRGSMPEDQRSFGAFDRMQMCVRRSVRRLDLDDRHPLDAASAPSGLVPLRPTNVRTTYDASSCRLRLRRRRGSQPAS